MVSQSGDGIFEIALGWLVLITTGSPLLVGVTLAAVLSPSVLVGPAAGVYADRLNRRNLMIMSSMFQGVITAVISGLYLLGVLSFPPLILLVLLLYSGAEFYRAANSAMLPSIVSRENLGAANGLFTLSTSANQLNSYAIGALAIGVISYTALITYDSLTFFFAAAMLTVVAVSYGSPRAEGAHAGAARPDFLKEFKGGLSYVRGNKLFLELSVFGLLANFFGSGFSAVVAPYVRDQLGGTGFSYGLIYASLPLGVIVGSIIVGKINFRGYVGKILFLGVALFGPIAILAALSTTVPVGLLLFFGLGAISGAVNIPIQVLVQTQIPREMLGRAATVLRALLGIAAPIAAVTFGLIAQLTSVAFVFAVTGVSIVAMAAALYFPFKELRNAKY